MSTNRMNFRSFTPALFVVFASMIPQAAHGQTNSITLYVLDEGKQAINNTTVIVESYQRGQGESEAKKALEEVEIKRDGAYTAGNTDRNKDKVLQFIVLAGDNKENYRAAIVRNIDGSFENRLAIIPPLFKNREEDRLIIEKLIILCKALPPNSEMRKSLQKFLDAYKIKCD